MKGLSPLFTHSQTVQCSRQKCLAPKAQSCILIYGFAMAHMSLMTSCFIDSNEIMNVQARTISCFGNRIVRWEGFQI